jgi:hypothetical protein
MRRQRIAEEHEVDARHIQALHAWAGGARLVLVDDGIRPFDLQVIPKDLPVVGVVVDN